MTNDDRLADVVNQEPIVFMDCTQSELAGSFIAGAVVGTVLGIVIGIAIGFLMLGVMAGLIIALGVAWGLMNWLRYIRQKFYLTWFNEKLFLLQHSLGLVNRVYVDVSTRFGKGARRA